MQEITPIDPDIARMLPAQSAAKAAFVRVSLPFSDSPIFALAVWHAAKQRGVELRVVASPPQAEGVPHDVARQWYVQNRAGQTFRMSGFLPVVVKGEPVGPVTYGAGSTEEYILRDRANEETFRTVYAALPRPGSGRIFG